MYSKQSNCAELFEPGEYLDQRGPGYFTLAGRPEGRWVQENHEVTHLPQIVAGANPHIDTYISQAIFENRTRRAVHVDSVGLFFADLDTYQIDGLKNRSPEDQAKMLVSYCALEGIPAPSMVMFSGRGLQAKWLLTESLGRVNLPEWNAVQLALVKRLENFGSDTNARDVSRVLRLDHTVNTKSGEFCRVVYVNSGIDAVPTRYDFGEMVELFAEEIKEQTRPRPTRRQGNVIQYNPATVGINWKRLEDIRTLWKNRGGVPEGFREITLFWELNFLLLANPGKLQDIWKEAQSLAKAIDSRGGWYLDSDLSTVYKRAKAAADGEKVTFGGRTYPALYTPRNDYLINLFQIEPPEMESLITIITPEEKYRRKIQKRREQGIISREEYIKGSITAAAPWDQLGISRAWYYRLKQRGELNE